MTHDWGSGLIVLVTYGFYEEKELLHIVSMKKLTYTYWCILSYISYTHLREKFELRR